MKRYFLGFGILFAVPSLSQNVGIGTSSPAELLDVNGNTQTRNLRIPNFGSIDLGYGLPGKEVNAGRIGYGLFTANAVDMVGGGTGTDNRRIRFWAEAGSVFTGGASFSGNVGVGLASNANGKLEIHGRGGRAHNLALIDSAVNSAGSVLFANVSRPSSGLMLRGNSFGSGTAQNQVHFTSADGNTLLLTVRGDGRVGVMKANPAFTLDVGGDFNISGALNLNGNAGMAGKVLQSNGNAVPSWVSPTSSRFRNIFFDTLSFNTNLLLTPYTDMNVFVKNITLTDSAWILADASAYFKSIRLDGGRVKLKIKINTTARYDCETETSFRDVGFYTAFCNCAIKLPAGNYVLSVIFYPDYPATANDFLISTIAYSPSNGYTSRSTILRTEIIYQ